MPRKRSSALGKIARQALTGSSLSLKAQSKRALRKAVTGSSLSLKAQGNRALRKALTGSEATLGTQARRAMFRRGPRHPRAGGDPASPSARKRLGCLGCALPTLLLLSLLCALPILAQTIIYLPIVLRPTSATPTLTHTSQPSHTSTPSRTATPTLSATPSCTATRTPTMTPTATTQPSCTPTRTATRTPTPTPTAETSYYITDTGTKYHRAGCRYLNASAHAVTCSWAISNGYTACSVCDPVCP